MTGRQLLHARRGRAALRDQRHPDLEGGRKSSAYSRVSAPLREGLCGPMPMNPAPRTTARVPEPLGEGIVDRAQGARAGSRGRRSGAGSARHLGEDQVVVGECVGPAGLRICDPRWG